MIVPASMIKDAISNCLREYESRIGKNKIAFICSEFIEIFSANFPDYTCNFLLSGFGGTLIIC